MPWTEVTEPYAQPPRALGPLTAPGDAPVIDLEDRWGAIYEATMEGNVDLRACDTVEFRGSVFRGATLVGRPDIEIDATNCSFIDCDLSAIRFAKLTNSVATGCKVSGTDFGSGVLRDVLFERSILRMSVWRMAELDRVAFNECTLEEVDFYEAKLSHVSFEGSDIRVADFDKARFEHVDLRGVGELDVRSCRDFRGALMSADQVTALAFLFAEATGVSIERRSTD
jgi:hypothetical protein